MADSLRIDSLPRLERPILVAAFTAGTTVRRAPRWRAAYLAKTWDAEHFGASTPRISSTSRSSVPRSGSSRARPADRVAGDAFLTRGTEGSTVTSSSCRHRAEHPLAHVHGELRRARQRVGVELVVTLGRCSRMSRTRGPVPITGIAGDPDLVEQLGSAPRYEGPTGIVGVLHDACAEGRASPRRASGPPVPHYVH